MNTFTRSLLRGLGFGLGFGIARFILKRPLLILTILGVAFYFLSNTSQSELLAYADFFNL